MKFLASLALATLAVAAPSSKRAPSPLDVKLEASGNSAVKATITNNGKNDLKVLKTGTFLDSAPVEKAQVFAGGKLSRDLHCCSLNKYLIQLQSSQLSSMASVCVCQTARWRMMTSSSSLQAHLSR